MIRISVFSLALILTACSQAEPPVSVPVAEAAAPVISPAIDAADTQQLEEEQVTHTAGPTKILDRAAAAGLLSNSGITLQWIDWDVRGTVQSDNLEGVISLSGVQQAREGQTGTLSIEGHVTEIGSDYFIFSGEISIVGTPIKDRVCKVTRDDWRFAITQGRKYWRLRQFEWCDGLTDYVDIYF